MSHQRDLWPSRQLARMLLVLWKRRACPSSRRESLAHLLLMKVSSRNWIMISSNADAPLLIAAIYAQARALMDWNTRNTFCGTCGHRTLSVNAGTKRACPPTDAARTAEGLPQDRPECNTRTTLSNLSFPVPIPPSLWQLYLPMGSASCSAVASASRRSGTQLWLVSLNPPSLSRMRFAERYGKRLV